MRRVQEEAALVQEGEQAGRGSRYMAQQNGHEQAEAQGSRAVLGQEGQGGGWRARPGAAATTRQT